MSDHLHVHWHNGPRHAAPDDDCLPADSVDAILALLTQNHTDTTNRLHQLKEITMATQAEQDAYNTQIAAMAADIAEIKADKANDVTLDLSAGDAVKADLDSLVPAAPVVEPAPVDAPADPSVIQ